MSPRPVVEAELAQGAAYQIAGKQRRRIALSFLTGKESPESFLRPLRDSST
jgi:hypothetical protein